jgi:fructokinase
MRIVTIGEILWDVFPDGERLGGAPFNFSAHAVRLGHEVLFLSAVGDDPRGHAALQSAGELGLSTEFLRVTPGAPTGVVSVSLDPEGRPSFTIHRPAAYDHLRLSPEDLDALARFEPHLIYFGTLHQTAPEAKAFTRLVIEACPQARRFYDVNLRPDSYNLILLEELLMLADTVKLNADEAVELSRLFGLPFTSVRKFCEYWSGRCGWEVTAVTLGEKGCAIFGAGEWVEAPGYPVQVSDTVGSGDAFAASLVHGLSKGWPLPQVADLGNRVGALVASRPGAVPPWTLDECQALTR